MHLHRFVIISVAVVTLAVSGCGKPATSPEEVTPSDAAQTPQVPVAPQPSTDVAAPVPVESEAESTGEANTVTIYRDTWGVPHIYANTETAAAYGLGYAQAEDRLADLYANIRTATGTAAAAFGPDHIEADLGMQLVQNAEVCKKNWAETPEYLRNIATNFMAGVQRYADEHPEDVPEWAVELEPWHCAAIGRAMIMRWPLGTIFDDLRNRNKRPPMGSNEWSVAPSRTADNCAILLTDPHLSWEGMAVFYEARVHGGELHMNGFFLVGSPLLGFGHTEYMGWAPTTGGPDTSDVYEVKVDLSNELAPKYELNGEWKDAAPRLMTVNVKGQEPVIRPTADTELGPVVDFDEKAGIAYIGASPYFGPSKLFEQTYRMLLAKNSEEFYDALRMNEFMEQNLMYAGRDGTIGYVRAGKTPIRPEGHDWSAPVPASAETMWKGLHPIEDLVQIVNPPQGYMQNCNISPANMMKDSPLKPDQYPDYIYNVTWDVTNPRGKRITALLAGDDSITKEEALAYATDVYDILAKPWQNVLRNAISASGAGHVEDPDFAQFVDAFLAWNGNFTPEVTVTALYKAWRLNCNGKVNVTAIAEGRTLTPEDKIVLLGMLKETIAEFKAQYAATLVPWGELYRVGRDDKMYPAPGADFGGSTDGPNFTETLFDVKSRKDPNDPGKYVAYDGTAAAVLMFFHKDRVESYTCIPWGQSTHPDSPHYSDQGELLYSKRQMKPTWFTREEIMAHKESEEVLTIP